jgi:hypothetical protein
MEYAISTHPEDITSWTFRTDFLPDEFGYTYPKAIFADGSIYVFFRSRGHGGSSLNQGKYACIISNDYGESWSKQIEFVDASNNKYAISVYPTTAKYANGYFHVTWYLMLESGPYSNYYGPRSNETQYNAYYAKSLDGIAWYNIDESHTSEHITMNEMDKFYQVYNTTDQKKVIGQHNEDYSFIRYRTTKPPRMVLSSYGIPYIGLKPSEDGGIIRIWNENQWRTILLPNNVSYIPFFVKKEISEIPVNALCYRKGKIYLTNYGYFGNEDEIRIIGRDTYKINEKTQTLDFIYHYGGPSLIFKEGISYNMNYKIKNYNNNSEIQQILKLLEPYPFLRSWFLNHYNT